jgi:protein KTI12
MVRWDAPLFTVPWNDENVPGEEIWKAVTEGTVKPPNAGTQAVRLDFFPLLQLLTRVLWQVAKAPSDALRTLESTSSALVSALLAEQSASGSSGGPIILSYSPAAPSIRVVLPARTLTLSELQRHKRAFVTVHKKAITLGTVEKGVVDWGEEAVAEKFARYLEENVKQ